MKSELKIKAIENGTVIDHITANKSLHILKILGLPDDDIINVTVAMNVSSKETGRKDIVKIENREIEQRFPCKNSAFYILQSKSYTFLMIQQA